MLGKKKHILHGRYADLTFLFKIMDFLLNNANRHALYIPTFINNKSSSLENLSFQLINKVHVPFSILPEMLF